MKNFTLFTQPKTGTYLLGPLLEKITKRKMRFGLSNIQDYLYDELHQMIEYNQCYYYLKEL
jgi:hypothetical protein